MPGFLLHEEAVVFCMHLGPAKPTKASQRVKVGGQPITTMLAPYEVDKEKCIFKVLGVPSPCVAAGWISAATRVRSGNEPVLLADSQAVCAPNLTGVIVVQTQFRVKGI